MQGWRGQTVFYRREEPAFSTVGDPMELLLSQLTLWGAIALLTSAILTCLRFNFKRDMKTYFYGSGRAGKQATK